MSYELATLCVFTNGELRMNKLLNCPFCEQAFKSNVYNESGSFLAAYNIAPILPGHSIIVSKKHISSLLELSEEEKQEAMRKYSKTGGKLDIRHPDSCLCGF